MADATVLTTPTADTAALQQRFRPVFARIYEGARERERDRVFAHEQVRWLLEAGFGTIRLPESHGGLGASLHQAFGLLAELGAADANVAHVFRNHWAFVEDRLVAPVGPETEVWLERFRDGDLVGGGWTEAGGVPFSRLGTRVVSGEDGHRLTGQKFYATGSLYADWLDVIGLDDAGQPVTALTPREQEGVELIDDWPGFGQRTTASGTARYHEALVDPHGIFPARDRFAYQGLFYQTSLLAILVGIAQTSWEEARQSLLARTRNYPLGLDPVPSEDAQLRQVIGRLRARVFGAEAALAVQTATLDDVAGLRISGIEVRGTEELRAATLATAEAQLVIVDAALEVTTGVFDALGASGTSESVALDRHWRNARTLASHNPRVYKERLIGDWHVGGQDPSDVEDLFLRGGQGV